MKNATTACDSLARSRTCATSRPDLTKSQVNGKAQILETSAAVPVKTQLRFLPGGTFNSQRNAKALRQSFFSSRCNLVASARAPTDIELSTACERGLGPNVGVTARLTRAGRQSQSKRPSTARTNTHTRAVAKTRRRRRRGRPAQTGPLLPNKMLSGRALACVSRVVWSDTKL